MKEVFVISAIKLLKYVTPPIISYQFHAFPLSVLSLYDDCISWFYKNYIQLKCKKYCMGISDLQYDFVAGNIYGGIPCLDYYIYEKTDIINEKSGFNQFIINILNEGLYFYTFVDIYYIPNTNCYKKRHVLHDILVLGNDSYSECYYVMHFTDKGDLSVFKVSYADFFNGFINSSQSENIVRDLVITIRKNNTKPKVNADYIKNEINIFLNSNVLSYRIQMYFSDKTNIHYESSYIHDKLQIFTKNWTKSSDMMAWGVSTYKEIIKYYKDPSTCKIYYDIRPLHLLWEHKKMMILRIKYLQKIIKLPELNQVLNDYSELEKVSLNIRNSIIKFNVVKNDNILKRIRNNLYKIMDRECYTLEKLYKNL